MVAPRQKPYCVELLAQCRYLNSAMPDKPPKNPQDIVDDDQRALAEFLAGVTPVQPSERVQAPRQAPSDQPEQLRADEQAVMETLLDSVGDDLELEQGDELLWRAPGLQNNVIRKLRRGHYTVGASVDLHGLFVADARPVVVRFLEDAKARDLRCVKIIHGKGLRSRHRGPVLKNKLAVWLKRRDDVLAYASAPQHDGGTGAVYVLLRR